MDRKDGLIHMILGEKRIRWGRGEKKTEKKGRLKTRISYSVIYIGDRFDEKAVSFNLHMF